LSNNLTKTKKRDRRLPIQSFTFYYFLQYRLLACLQNQSKSGFFGGPAFSNQSGHFENFSDWLDNSRPSKKDTFVLIMKTG